MKRLQLSVVVSLLFGSYAVPASAHHNSNSFFEVETTIELQGSVTRFDWKNPHMYFFLTVVDETGEETLWKVEGSPLAFMRRLGWDRDTLQPGDNVTVTVNPSRNPKKKSALLKDITVVGRDIPSITGEDAFRKAFGNNAEELTKQASSLHGTWATIPSSETLGRLQDPEKLALTEAGESAVNAYDERTMHPALECIPYTTPIFMLVPDIKQIVVEKDIVRIRGEFDGTERIIYVNGEAPQGRTVHGRSKGHWDGTTLVIETSRFTDHRLGNASEVPSGAHKKIIERLQLQEDGKSLHYSFELTDPEFLAEPVTGEGTLVYRPDLDFRMLECDLENSRMYLED
tara:strand:+ start:1740 stop:2768 length:1029 start_codon:yes stop_codon:yes gene_type:complete